MPHVTYQQAHIETQPNEVLLDAFLRQGQKIPFSCRGGICHICLLKCSAGHIPPAAQRHLNPELQQQGYLLACQCIPDQDMVLEAPDPAQLYKPATVLESERLSPTITRLRLNTDPPLKYAAGQYIHLRRWDGTTRSYSLASSGQPLELHVRHIPGGRLSHWLCDHVQPGQQVEIMGPHGDCYYRSTYRHTPLTLVATGTGLAPIWGILQDALSQDHQADITLYHGGHHPSDLYLDSVLRELMAEHPQFQYFACVSGPKVPPGYVAGRAHDIALQHNLAGHVVYACGRPEMVTALESQLPQTLTAFYADPFLITAEPISPAHQEETHVFPPPDPEMWAALQEGVLLRQILDDFYAQVFADEQLNPFFQHTDPDHAASKQFNFLYEVFSGEDVYFGEMPRNAHHWMVISDALFDYRAGIMERTLRKHGLPEHLIARWMGMENGYRKQIVKREPWPKMAFGLTFPLDGYESIQLSGGGICDGCHQTIESDAQVCYHMRLGTVYCTDCLKNL